MALRFAAGFDQMMMVLSGMSSVDQLRQNVSFMADAAPLSPAEQDAVGRVREILQGMKLIPCTGCRYCVDGCPMGILIPDMFKCLNLQTQFHDWNQRRYYNTVLTKDHGKASQCVKCGACEGICPQGLAIRDLLEQVAQTFESPEED